MSDINPVIATPIVNFDSYEDLAHSGLPDNTLVYSDVEGIKYQEPQASGFFSGSSVDHEESLDHEKSRADFSAAIAGKFGSMPAIKEERSPLTLGRIRAVIKEESLKADVEQLKTHPLFASNPQLALLLGKLKRANEEAAQAEAELDKLGYPQEHIEQVVRDAGKLLLDAGITVGTVGAAAHIVCVAAIGFCLVHFSSSTLAGLITPHMVTLLKKFQPPEEETSLSHLPTLSEVEAAIPKAATETAVAGEIIQLLEGIGRTHVLIGFFGACIIASSDVRALLCKWIDHAIKKCGGNFAVSNLSDQVAQLFKEYNISISTSYQKTEATFSSLNESEENIQQALINVIATRALANQLSKEIAEMEIKPKEESELAESDFSKSEVITEAVLVQETLVVNTIAEKVIGLADEFEGDLQELSKIITTSAEAIEKFKDRNQSYLDQSMKVVVEGFLTRIKQMDALVTEMRDISLLSQERLQKFIALAEANLATIKEKAGRWSSLPAVEEFNAQITKALQLAQKLKEAVLSLPVDSALEDGPILQQAVELKTEDFFKAVEAGLKTGMQKAEKLTVRNNNEVGLSKTSKVVSAVLSPISKVLDSTTRMTNSVVNATADAGGPPGLSF